MALSSVRSLPVCNPIAARCLSVLPVTTITRGSKRNVSARAADMTPEMREQMAKAMQDPAMQERMKAMQEMMQKPEMQQQLSEMQAYMQNQQLQQRMQSLRNDPELKSVFEEIQSGGMGALMKYMNDPKVLAKIGEKIGDVQVEVPPAGAAAAGAAAPSSSSSSSSAAAAAANIPEIDNLFDAARYGDLEAVEDFIAIGKDVNAADKDCRTPLHYASGFDHSQIAQMLIDEGAQLEAKDNKGNTPLHYAAGYGRAQLVELLLSAGSDASAKNNDGQTPYQLVTANERNPLNKNLPVVDKLREGATV